ncbi:MAG: hypothetical protein JXR60_05770 [Bacteroidales bacterium]|nr:hypothetical protein [Bacteroidales bacterium]
MLLALLYNLFQKKIELRTLYLNLKVLLIFLAGFLSTSQYAQNNDWINYNQKYVCFKIYEDGIYRINRNTLSAINTGFITVNPKNLQVFARGEEQAIFVYGENDLSFDSGDYIEFYARKNDGSFDLDMYEDASQQNNPYHSQINDTIYYYVTWKDSPEPKRRIQTYSSVDYNNYSPISSVKEIKLDQFNSKFYWGQRISDYSSGKGWFDATSFVYGSILSKSINTSHRISTSSVDVEYSVCGAPNSDVYSNLQHFLKVRFNNVLYDSATYTGYQGVIRQFSIPSSQITQSTLSLKFSSNYNIGGQVDRNVLAYIRYSYERDLDYSTDSMAWFTSMASTQPKRISFENINGSDFALYNITSNTRTIPVVSGSNVEAIIQNSTEDQEYILMSSQKRKYITSIKNIQFTNYSQEVSHPDYIIVYPKVLESAVANYAQYRSSQGYQVLKAEISDLYHQFGNGIEKHPLSIRNFIKFLDNQYSLPSYLLLVGKSISSANIRNNADAWQQCLVPTMGNPPSDVLITSGLDGTLSPAVSTGRLAIRTNDELQDYLNKIISYDTPETGLWQKRALFLGGGSTTYEQTTFSGYLNQYKDIYSDTLTGGFGYTFLKNSSDPIQISVSDSVANLINEGVELMTFFGHGSSSGFDQSIDEPSNYNNYGKYPIIVANSCLSGDVHQNTDYQTISEKWVLIPDKGSIAFLASADLGYASQLHLITKEWYKNLAYKNYGNALGDIIRASMDDYSENQSTNLYVKKTIYDNTLHGDPAIVPYFFDKPDLQIQPSGIRLSVLPITNEIDSFPVQVTFYNLARTINENFVVSIERVFPDGTSEYYSKTLTYCYYSSSFELNIPTKSELAIGLNKIIVRLDNLNQIDELDESNNVAELDFIVQTNDLVPIFPYEYAVYPNAEVTLKASSGDLFLGDFNAVFQIDTSDQFNSPLMRESTIATNGGITSWDVPTTLTDSIVYYWRVSIEGSNRWNYSSFRYISNKEGWSQAHYFQFEKDDFQFINYDRNTRDYTYITTPKNLICRTIGSVPESRLPEVGYWIDGVGDQSSCGGGSAFNVVVIDSISLEPWLSDREDFGHRDYPKCFSRTNPDHYFQFTATDSTSMENFAAMLNAIPDGMHVLIYSIWNGNFAQLPENSKLAFESLYPATQIRTIPDNYPYILYVQKGKLSSAFEEIGSSVTDEIDINVSLKTNFDYGLIHSVLIGPAINWQSFHWNYYDQVQNKNTHVSIAGVTQHGTEQILVGPLPEDSLDVYSLEQRIDANQYPLIKLMFYSKDSITRVPTQLQDWTVLYTPVPETAIDLDLPFAFYNDTLQQGDNVSMTISTQNVSLFDMDSLLVRYKHKDQNNNTKVVRTVKLRPHPSLDILTDTVRLNTIDLQGNQSLWVEFNPTDSLTGEYDQLEQYHFNNIAVKYFYVQKDRTNPLLNVTFDGFHIMDGDIVSPNPNILIVIDDENQYLNMDDANKVSVFLKHENWADEVRMTENDSSGVQQLFWTPSSLPENKAEMLFQPKSLEDGLYTLRVGATDASNNESGSYDYTIHFKVVNKSTITEILNYPNPFSTSTQFVFTLTGAEIPEEIVIQIMTVTGKLVQEINLSEVSHLRIGKNITDYKWDGTDMYGDRLANGVYFYRIFTKMNGNRVEHMSTDADQYFKKGIGKMYIMR